MTTLASATGLNWKGKCAMKATPFRSIALVSAILLSIALGYGSAGDDRQSAKTANAAIEKSGTSITATATTLSRKEKLSLNRLSGSSKQRHTVCLARCGPLLARWRVHTRPENGLECAPAGHAHRGRPEESLLVAGHSGSPQLRRVHAQFG